MLKPYFVPHRQTITAELYSNMLKEDALRQIETSVGGEHCCFQHDLAGPHTAKTTQDLLEKEGAATAPWMPAGADLTPLDETVKAEVRGRDISSIPKLKREVSLATVRLNSSPKYMGELARTCLAFGKRVH